MQSVTCGGADREGVAHPSVLLILTLHWTDHSTVGLRHLAAGSGFAPKDSDGVIEDLNLTRRSAAHGKDDRSLIGGQV